MVRFSPKTVEKQFKITQIFKKYAYLNTNIFVTNYSMIINNYNPIMYKYVVTLKIAPIYSSFLK